MFPVLDSHAQPEVRAGRAPNSQPGDARARGRGQGFQHLQRCRSVRLGLQRAGRRALQHPAEGLLGLGQRRRNRPLVLRRPGCGEGAGLLAACLAPAQRGRNLARPQQRADRHLRAEPGPDAARRRHGLHAGADRRRDRSATRGRREHPHRRDAALPHARQRHRRAVRQSARDEGRHARLRRAVARSRGAAGRCARREWLPAAVRRPADAAARRGRERRRAAGDRGAEQHSAGRWSAGGGFGLVGRADSSAAPSAT